MPSQIRQHIEDPNRIVLVSAVFAWEVSIKSKLGKLQAPTGLIEAALSTGLVWVPIEPEEALAAGELPLHHRDPFDRLLVAQAQARKTQLVSRDMRLDDYGVERLWT